MRNIRMTPLGATTFAVRVDSYEQGNLSGAVDSVLLPKPLEFSSTSQLILQLDELMDNEDFEMAKAMGDSSFVSTLELEVLFRQHHSWQGRVKLHDGNQEIAFRSVLELLVALDMLLGD